MKKSVTKKGSKKTPVKLSVRSTPVRATRFSVVLVPVGVFALAVSFAVSLWWSPVLSASAAVDPLYVQCHNHQNDNGNPLIDLKDPACNGAANTAPTADDQTLSTAQDVAVIITLTAGDADNDLLYYATTSSPTNGTLSVLVAADTTATLTYTPNSGFTGSDPFNFRVNDGRVADNDTGTITINVTAPEAPATYTLTASAVGPGSVASDPANPHTAGSIATTTATPGAHAHWVSWSQEGCSTSEPCATTMNNDASITATFACDEGFNPPSEGVDCSAPAPQQESSNSGSSGSGGGGSGGGGGVVSGPLSIGFVNTNNNNSNSGGTSGLVLGTSTEALPAGCSAYLTGNYMRLGATGPEVKKLQEFLNKELGLSLPVSGIFGPMTDQAVRDFQVKYWAEVLKPWVPHGLKDDHTSTGYVYKTTKRWINLLQCQSLDIPLPVLP